MRHGKPCSDWRNNQPGKQTPDDPIAFPCPALYFFIWDVETARGKTTYEMKNNPEDDLHNNRMVLKYGNQPIYRCKNTNSTKPTLMICHEDNLKNNRK